jgi:hypothetical protein
MRVFFNENCVMASLLLTYKTMELATSHPKSRQQFEVCFGMLIVAIIGMFQIGFDSHCPSFATHKL